MKNSFIQNQKTIFINQNGAVTGSRGQNRTRIYFFFFWANFQMFCFEVPFHHAREEMGEITDSALMWQNLGMFDYEVLLHLTEEEMRVVTVSAFVFQIKMDFPKVNSHVVEFCCFVITFFTLLRVTVLKFGFVRQLTVVTAFFRHMEVSFMSFQLPQRIARKITLITLVL